MTLNIVKTMFYLNDLIDKISNEYSSGYGFYDNFDTVEDGQTTPDLLEVLRELEEFLYQKNKINRLLE